ncbi:MAG: 50S ribosomal protein L28 [Firmicutes bacterium ADurb.BinA052]|nr:MAG: 50S ribosomal protein L28 [Firmicutes bacterium ADurb.BinA052]
MPKMCAVCGKSPSAGNNVSHSELKTRRRWYPNLQKVRAMVDGSPRRITVCTRCLRSGKVTRAI